MTKQGLKVFVVEDDAIIRMMVVGMLEELGHSIAAEAGRMNNALELARSTDFDVAVLDVNIVGNFITPVAEVIKGRGLPFIFATGYGSAGVPVEFTDRAVLRKPFELRALAAAIDEATR